MSDRFTKTSKEKLLDILDPLVEIAVTETKRERNERCRKLLHEIMPVILESVAGDFRITAHQNFDKEKIIEESLKKVGQILNYEEILYPEHLLKYSVEAELNKQLKI